MRKLASVKTISDIIPIKDKDRIELAIIDGWQVIVKKGEYKIGDKTIFLEIDSIVPKENSYFAFMERTKYRVKTLKMAGVVSQGLCVPMSMLKKNEDQYEVGDDVTDEIGILKWDNSISTNEECNTKRKLARKYPAFLMRYNWFRKLVLPRKEYRGFPDFISKTDETRIQNMPWVLKDKSVKWTVREKIDGQSGTFVLKRKKSFWKKSSFEFIVCSRNMRLFREDNSSYWSVARKYKIESILKNIIREDENFVAIQGEIIGPGIQGNKYSVSDYEFYVFNVIRENKKLIGAGKEIEETVNIPLTWCPLITTKYVLPDTVNELLDYATGRSVLKDTLREGFVFRNEKGMSFKAVSPDFLIKHDE